MEEFLETILIEALELEVTDLHFKSMNESCVYMRLKNEIIPFKHLKQDQYKRLVTFLQFKAQLDFNLLGQPQTGTFQLQIKNQTYYFRLSYIPSLNDIHLVLRILNHQKKISFHELTKDDEMIGQLKEMFHKETGLIVVCGPTGSGKSTTLHSFLEEINTTENKSIVTIEDPIEIDLENIIQIQINEQKGVTFQSVLQQVLRHDPDIIMIGELRDEKSAEIALKLALSGHLIFVTMHASDGISAIKRLLNLGISKDDLYQNLIGIISQRLFYHQKTKEPFVVFEIVKREHIVSYLLHQQINYVTLKENIEKFYRKEWLSEKDYQKYN